MTCVHECRLEFGVFWMCFDCGAESVPVVEAPAPSISQQRLEALSVRAFGSVRTVVSAGLPCTACGELQSSLHALIAHTSTRHAPAPVGASS